MLALEEPPCSIKGLGQAFPNMKAKKACDEHGLVSQLLHHATDELKNVLWLVES